MLPPDFDPRDDFSRLACPRCGSIGMDQISQEALQQVSLACAHRSIGAMDPALPVRCPGCGMVAEWPAVTQDLAG